MASSKEYLDFILDQIGAPDVTARAMMGEYVLYYRGKVFGGIYDDRLMLKPVKAACALLPDAPRELPYPGAKEMLLVEEVENGPLLRRLLQAMEPELPAPKKR
jgi:TfoX/Sxy family transcriptional regulator of competence genes